MARRRSTKTNGAIKVGDVVRFPFGAREVTTEVVEDRGSIGVGGRQLVAVLIPSEGNEPLRLEMPADELTVVKRAVSKA